MKKKMLLATVPKHRYRSKWTYSNGSTARVNVAAIALRVFDPFGLFTSSKNMFYRDDMG